MLDFSKLLPQFDSLGVDLLKEGVEEKIELAGQLLSNAGANAEALNACLEESRDLVFWPPATPLEPVDAIHQLAPNTAAASVVAVDGSQIMPSHHEVYNCYLINLGKICFSYGIEQPVLMESTPHLYHTVDDLYPLVERRRVHADEGFLSLERSLLELATLRDLAVSKHKAKLPVVAFVDGSLVQWSLHQMPDAYQAGFLARLIGIFDTFEKERIPVVGYISQSRSSDVINVLRTWQCPYERSDCREHCSQRLEEDFPCSTIWPVTDRQLFGSLLPHHCRGALFQVGHHNSQQLPASHRVCFTYLNVGKEIARVELPYWLAFDHELLARALSVTLSQVEKGSGYPVGLTEAHNLAVIRSSDRKQFFELVTRHLLQLGVQKVRVSPKEAGKRRTIV